jgi:RNA polymerase sigma-70 factor, ECF subfamily
MGSSLTPVPGMKKQGARLLVDVHEGVDGALAQLLVLYRPYLLAIANEEFDPALRAKAGPSDLVQETLVRATRRLPLELPRDESEFRAWLRKILIRRLDSLRKRYRRTAKRQIRRERSLDDVDVRDYLNSMVSAADQTPGSQAVANERRERVWQALKRLPKEYRTVILWHNRDGLGWPQIGLKLDRSPDAARMLWRRAVQQLANILRDKSEPA